MKKENGLVIASELSKCESDNYPEPLPFLCWENSLSYWFPKLKKLNIPVPTTRIVRGERKSSKMPHFDISKIEEAVKDVGGIAFIRGVLGSASYLNEGKINKSMREDKLEEKIMENIFDIEVQQRIYLGKEPKLVIREFLELKFEETKYGTEENHPHVRFFIRNGEVMDWYNRIESGNEESIRNSEEKIRENIKKLESWAKEAAVEFDLPYSIDFVMDKNENWYCIDMALDGIYWNKKKEKWHEISAHSEPVTENLEKTPDINNLENSKFYKH